MRVAVLYTGQLRTIRKTMPIFKTNVLCTPDVHVFACLQHDASESIQETTTWLQSELGDHLKVLQWFNPGDGTFINFREHLLHDLEISDGWKGYLRRSGSIIEYYQLQCIYHSLFRHETKQGFTYDYIIRCRPDTLFCKPITFDWLTLSEHEIQTRLQTIQDYCGQLDEENKGGEINARVFDIFMNTLLHKTISMDVVNPSYVSHRTKTFIQPQSPVQIQSFLKNGRYILTFRTNLLYIVKRDYFYLIPALGTMYSLFKFPLIEHQHWFNSETQFQGACYHTDLTIFDYESKTESDSLYNYEESRYFDSDGKLKDGALVYVLVRK
jgi:hypothetical protein